MNYHKQKPIPNPSHKPNKRKEKIAHKSADIFEHYVLLKEQQIQNMFTFREMKRQLSSKHLELQFNNT